MLKIISYLQRNLHSGFQGENFTEFVRMERTYIMIKPDGVQRGLVGEIISRFEKKGFKLQALKLFTPPRC
jgi:hypothetical protein